MGAWRLRRICRPVKLGRWETSALGERVVCHDGAMSVPTVRLATSEVMRSITNRRVLGLGLHPRDSFWWPPSAHKMTAIPR